MSPERGGTLYVVGTPIGNLQDITQRAVETLRQVGHIAAEDTRRTRALLSHLGLSNKQLHAVHAHGKRSTLERLIGLLGSGENVALVTDAGMPAVSDPGASLVELAQQGGLTVAVIPGPSAVTAAVAISGLVEGPFSFVGFLPRRGGKRKAALKKIAGAAEPTILFESPHRIKDTLADLSELIGEREAALCRELTKLHEEVRRGTLTELAAQTEWKGEITLVVAGSRDGPSDAEGIGDLDAAIVRRLAAGDSVKSIVSELSRHGALRHRELYSRVLGLQKSRG